MKKNIDIPVNPTYHEVKSDFAREWEKNRDAKYLEYRKKWGENPKNFILEDGPLHMDIEPTNACNLKCPMCPRTILVEDSASNFQLGKMNLATFKKIIDEAVTSGVYSIKLNWLGEPLVHPQIVEMVRYAKEKGIIDVMFNTNAVLLSEQMSEDLIAAGLDKIFFSFDSPFKEKYEQIRVGANFEETLASIQKFVAIRNKYGKNATLTRVSMVLMEDNKGEYADFVNLFKDITDIVAYVEYREPLGQGQGETNFLNNFACSQLWQRMFVAWDGDVIVCCVDSEKEYIVGNIATASIQDIWHNEKYMTIRELHQNGNFHRVSICKKCDLPFRRADGSI